MIERKKIMVDMDDVIVSGGFLYLINEFLGTKYKETDFKSFYMQDIIPNKQEFFKWFRSQNMYDYCILNGNVVEVLKELNELYDVFIGTSYLFPEIIDQSGFILPQKFEFLVKHFPFISPYNFAFLGNKNILNCEIRIDDRTDNLKGAETKILYTAYHNEDLSEELLTSQNIIRANNWDDVKRLLLKK